MRRLIGFVALLVMLPWLVLGQAAFAAGYVLTNGPIWGGDGTVGAPQFTFAADDNSGMYRIGSDNIGIGVGGAKVLDIGSAGLGVVGITKSGDGAVGAPSFSFTSDPDSGLYRIGANNIALGVNGAKVLDIGTAGLGVTGTLGVSGALTATAGGTLGGTYSGAVTWGGAQTFSAGLTSNGPTSFLSTGVGTGSYIGFGYGSTFEWYVGRTATTGNFSIQNNLGTEIIGINKSTEAIAINKPVTSSDRIALSSAATTNTAASIYQSGNRLRLNGGTGGYAFQDDTGVMSNGLIEDSGSWTFGPSTPSDSLGHVFNGANITLKDLDNTRTIFTSEGSVSYIDSSGVNGSTNGSFSFRTYRSDGTNVVTAGKISGAGDWDIPAGNLQVDEGVAMGPTPGNSEGQNPYIRIIKCTGTLPASTGLSELCDLDDYGIDVDQVLVASGIYQVTSSSAKRSLPWYVGSDVIYFYLDQTNNKVYVFANTSFNENVSVILTYQSTTW